MRSFALATIPLLCFALIIATGCGGRNKKDIGDADKLKAAVLTPSNEAEQAVLVQLENNPEAESFTVQGAQVHLGAPYFAASGAVCRSVIIDGPQGTTRLACRKDDRWFYSPDVFSNAPQDLASVVDAGEDPK